MRTTKAVVEENALEFVGDVDKLLASISKRLASGQSSSSWSSRIVLTSRDEYRSECRDKNRLECGFEFKCVFGSRFVYGFELKK